MKIKIINYIDYEKIKIKYKTYNQYSVYHPSFNIHYSSLLGIDSL